MNALILVLSFTTGAALTYALRCRRANRQLADSLRAALYRATTAEHERAAAEWGASRANHELKVVAKALEQAQQWRRAAERASVN